MHALVGRQAQFPELTIGVRTESEGPSGCAISGFFSAHQQAVVAGQVAGTYRFQSAPGISTALLARRVQTESFGL